MQHVTIDGQIELSLPTVFDPSEYSCSPCTKNPKVYMKMHLEIKDAVITGPSGVRIVFPRLVIDRMSGVAMPVVGGNNVVTFKVEDSTDKPITIKGE